MAASAFALALAAAALHAGWNVLIAGARDVRAATTVTLALSVLFFAPVVAVTWNVEWGAVPWIATSAALELVYFVLLVAAYTHSDVSLVYPVARGAAPVVVLLGSALAGASIGGAQGLGVVLVGVGVVLVRGPRPTADTRGLVLALAIAATIGAYTLVDNEGIERASTIAYLELVLLPVALATVVFELVSGRRKELWAAVGSTTVGAAVATFGAYALVLAALARAPAAPVAAVRESGVLFVVALGAVALHEQVSRWRVVGAVLVVAGVGLVALA